MICNSRDKAVVFSLKFYDLVLLSLFLEGLLSLTRARRENLDVVHKHSNGWGG